MPTSAEVVDALSDARQLLVEKGWRQGFSQARVEALGDKAAELRREHAPGQVFHGGCPTGVCANEALGVAEVRPAAVVAAAERLLAAAMLKVDSKPWATSPCGDYGLLIWWNDKEGRTLDQVLAAFDAAISEARNATS